MGASSSSAFWVPISYKHHENILNAFYEKQEQQNLKITHNIQFSISDTLQLLNKRKLFSDITLILDIDLTLGEALTIHYDYNKGFMLNQQPCSHEKAQQLVDSRNAEWFHNKTCLFVLRPYFKEFIEFCDNNFNEVIIWTNGVQKHADDMVNLIEKTIGKRWKGYGRTFSTYDRKIVTSIGLDPNKTWLVDDDHRHYYKDEHGDDTKEVNPDIKFFHGPEFSISWFKDFPDKINLWGNELEFYDDWFLFLIWNWNYMKENNMDMLRYDRSGRKFVYSS